MAMVNHVGGEQLTLQEAWMSKRLYKVLDHDRMPCNGGSGQWPEPGEWRTVDGEIVACENGLHYCEGERDLLEWLGPVIWRFEAHPDATIIRDGDKSVTSCGRLVAPVMVWDARTARLFAADCAAHVVPLYERAYPSDTRPHEAIAVARRYANGAATDAELAAAWDAAWDAAGTAARAAAWDAAWDAARAAARAAAWAAAGTAARAAARAAAGDAAWAAAETAAGTAAGTAEQQWQAERLRQYLDGEWDDRA